MFGGAYHRQFPTWAGQLVCWRFYLRRLIVHPTFLRFAVALLRRSTPSVLVVALTAGVIVGCNEKADESHQEARYIALHQERIKGLLRDPDSAQFRNVYVSRSLGAPLVCGEVNARNGLGGYDGFRRFVSAGDQQAIEGSNMASPEMDKLWSQACARR